jgi:cytochrome P450
MKPLHLSDGRVIPAGCFISMATEAIAHDPKIYLESEQFDGYRFYNKRKSSAEASHQYQFATTSPESMAFGHGKFACPGRFFASAIIKVMVVTILTEYDISFPDSQTKRPENLFLGETIRPDQSQAVVFSPRS